MEWIEVNAEEDIDGLLNKFNYFHDSCLKELIMHTDSYVNKELSMGISTGLDTTIRMLFQRQGEKPSAIELLFEGVTQFQLRPSSENHDSIILDAVIFLQDGSYYWTDYPDWKPGEVNQEVTYISAKHLKWRDVSPWMGAKKRFGVLHED
ncbi:hypothetical protein GMD78_05835 [Ornithinibacillus sp. L9]|uniref:Uncharacterized protein n=1 Tax=Ornithinibacillus caprae TaxID=2678566 RepID=A0A6N8FKV5_9BACI|nr:hypothetical protein [Ornithinibacillus caprae]MUK87918.1 hypothetical protein [Ornithinibacillus caprae]